ncbi:helix-turn-helix domain-containing protein [Romboutsia hominis]|uniref:helix-turn-helix domain-containing protein n=1 Tax=Romboutsia hominis TaxID=1507512 RepID=UPI001F06C04B|nr:helix-turn-helix domain-containing protein [Romboutsia hominis]MCH1959696.1 helix-turn-helix domain-containing protein [Romboutsia hominis]MCH1969881.1 helix-turn-helix domain-containing protein [Romboutsia hominis]
MEDYLLTVAEVAKRLCTDKNTVYKLIKSGELKTLKLKSYKVRNLEIQRFLAENEGKDLNEIIK